MFLTVQCGNEIRARPGSLIVSTTELHTKAQDNGTQMDRTYTAIQGFGAGAGVFGWSRSRHFARLRLHLKYLFNISRKLDGTYPSFDVFSKVNINYDLYVLVHVLERILDNSYSVFKNSKIILSFIRSWGRSRPKKGRLRNPAANGFRFSLS